MNLDKSNNAKEASSSLEIILGPMFSGKTTELMRRINRHAVIGNKILTINSIKDTRCNSEIRSHNNSVFKAVKIENLNDILKEDNPINLLEYDVVAIDEAQFFSDLLNFVTEVLITKYKLVVIVTGLNGDFRQNIFGEILFLIPHAEKVDLLQGLCTVCKDGTPGCFSSRIIENGHQTLVGDKNSYVCVCRKHNIIS